MLLAEAASSNDALAEEIGLAATCERLGVDVRELLHVAEQRALRLLKPELCGWQREEFLVKLTASEKTMLSTLAALSMDGIAIGLRAAKEHE